MPPNTVASTPQTPPLRPVSVLTVAGSDSGGGAGIQADLRTFAAHRVHGLSAIAALTAQNTRTVAAVHLPPASFLARQLDVLFDDFAIGAVKIGMLGSADLIEAVAEALAARPALPVVLDPVMIASSGAALLQADALHALVSRLLPLADVLTPNLPEAEALLRRPIDAGGMTEAAAALQRLVRGAVLLKGGHLEGERLVDVYFDGTAEVRIEHPRLPLEGHGTGCTLAAAIAARIARGAAPDAACRGACDYVHGALRHAYRPGRGTVAVLDHFWKYAPDAARN